MAKNLEGLTIDICLPEVWFSVNLSVPKIYFALLVSTNERTRLIKTDQSQAQGPTFQQALSPERRGQRCLYNCPGDSELY